MTPAMMPGLEDFDLRILGNGQTVEVIEMLSLEEI
jgi:hypothetical protein